MPELLSGNVLLAALPRGEAERLSNEMALVSLSPREVLQELGTNSPFCYFPVSSVVSLRSVLRSGASVEVAPVGREGMVGMGVLLSEHGPICRAVVQSPGKAWRIASGALREQYAASAAMRAAVGGFMVQVMGTAAQAAVCNGQHSVQQRMARWLLSMDDRIGEGGCPATQEGLSEILGARRPTITLTAQGLQERGLISYRRARIFVRDRAGLEAVACECYRPVGSR